MLVLTETTDKIQVVLGGNITTNQLVCFACYRDFTGGTGNSYEAGRNAINTNNTTDVDVVGSPASGSRRVIDFLSIYNRDTVGATVTVKLDANGTEFILAKVNLGPDERLEYADGAGFKVIANNGAVKNAMAAGSNVVATGLQNVVLGADVTNNNATANTMADVTGLSFPVTAGSVFWFQFFIWYTAAATTTGSRWSINGPASPTRLGYRSNYSLTTTTETTNSGLSAYDLPAASNASSAQAAGATVANLAVIEGFIIPSGAGNVVARFASEISSSAIVAKAGSFVRYIQQ